MLWTLPLLPAVLGLALAGRKWHPAIGWTATAALAALTAGAALAAVTEASATFGWGPRLALTLRAEGLARVVVVLVPVVATAVVAWVAASGGAHEPRPARLVGVLIAFTGAMELLVLAADLLTLLMAWELVGVCSWVLIGHRYEDPDRTRAAQQAYVTTRAADVGLFAAAGAALAGAGSLAYTDLSRASDGWLAVVAAGVLLAAAAKSAQLPFSPWLFPAMAGPTPVSALLHSATMVAAGAYALARLAPEFEGVAWFGDAVAWLGVATAIAGGIVATAAVDLKRALAASTSAQYGLVLVAVGAGATGAAGAHLVTHATFKALLFLGAGVVAAVAGTLDVRRLGLGWSHRTLVAVFVVGAAALAGVPPLGGAWSKEEVLAAAAHDSPALAAAVVAAGALSALYAARLVLLVFGGAGSSATTQGKPARAELAPLVALAAASVALGALWLPGGGGLVEDLTGGALAGGAAWELPVSVAALAVALAAAVALARRERRAAGATGPVQAFAASWFALPAVARAAVVDPVLALARLLARADDAVIDAGVRAPPGVAGALSRLLGGMAEVNLDRAVRAVAGAWLAAARASRTADDRGVDAAVEGMAAGTVALGGRARRLQTGLAHHYYLLVAGGLVALVVAFVIGSS